MAVSPGWNRAFYWIMAHSVPELLLAGAVALLMAEPGDRLKSAGVTFFALEALQLTLWLLRSCYYWFVFFVYGREVWAGSITHFLQLNRFPMPQEDDAAERYLSRVMNTADHDIHLRLKSAIELGSISLLRTLGFWQEILKTLLSWERAFFLYRRGF